MPLLDAYGREIPVYPRSVRKPKRPKNIPSKRRTSSKSIQAVTANTTVTITLRARHGINGVPYGPGRVTVPRKIANGLLEQDGRAAAADANFTSTRACVIGPGRTKGSLGVREVAPEFFDQPELSMVPFGVVDRASGAFHIN